MDPESMLGHRLLGSLMTMMTKRGLEMAMRNVVSSAASGSAESSWLTTAQMIGTECHGMPWRPSYECEELITLGPGVSWCITWMVDKPTEIIGAPPCDMSLSLSSR